ncbi:MAG: cold shock domain-containing protein [Candidatus Acidiferrales bacterium]
MQGTVKKYERSGAWGFILADDPNLPDCFVHHSFIQAERRKKFLNEGDRVEFDYAEDEQGRPQARNVRKLETPQPEASRE